MVFDKFLKWCDELLPLPTDFPVFDFGRRVLEEGLERNPGAVGQDYEQQCQQTGMVCP